MESVDTPDLKSVGLMPVGVQVSLALSVKVKIMIEIIDNFLEESDLKSFYNFCLKAPYFYGEKDAPYAPPTGLITPINEENFWFEFFKQRCENKFNMQQKIYRMYINLFLPNEKPYYHIDGTGNDKTLLFYPNPNFNLDQGGETKFIVNNEIKGVLPIPNRAILFNANIKHCATPFRDKSRFTLAIKYAS